MPGEPNRFVESSYEFSSNFDRLHASQHADDGMSGETVPVEEAEAMDSSAADADIDAEAAVRIVDGIGSFGAIEFSSLTAKDVLTTEFTSLQAAYDYYNEFGRIKGFSVRRSKGRRARRKTHAAGRQRSHRAVKEWDLHQINSMRKSGLQVPTIFRAFTNQSGGFETVGFEIKDIYNAIEKQRRVGATDAESALKFLGTLRTTDSGFDATYGRNKYKCPLVIFSGVDHHMRTVVFGCAILSNESKSKLCVVAAVIP
ncbi:protein FAR-RED ELONGATED HYPOCOTYL 3-like [Arachis ipaensis]|uniref:protein FAR-RED ELONGATED HYPOCOTYL 3-like n=1 Tax=Arachis ipaensis TaxID=130454 RepID=UPI0007AF029E|nr:protein FAR-RED ELONGATED HYPOCOTYL 3-like [Arachis ipaensis]